MIFVNGLQQSSRTGHGQSSMSYDDFLVALSMPSLSWTTGYSLQDAAMRKIQTQKCDLSEMHEYFAPNYARFCSSLLSTGPVFCAAFT